MHPESHFRGKNLGSPPNVNPNPNSSLKPNPNSSPSLNLNPKDDIRRDA